MPPAAVEPFLLGYGVLGLMALGLLFGFIVPKWVIDEYRKREALKDATIERLTVAIERLADRLEGK